MKIGIVTHYYQSKNYGGNLQAYALCKVLAKMGHTAEQISLDRSLSKNIKGRIKDILDSVLRYHGVRFSVAMRSRNRALTQFNQTMIPHSKVYTEKSIVDCANSYEAYITGSDQVWHPQACCDAYLLKFVPSSKVKISYAASVATDVLPDECKQRYKKAFADYRAISVREKNAIQMLQDISPVEIVCTLDPTLLLSKEEWESVVEPYQPEEKYVFSFFLGDDEKQRTIVKEFSRKHGLKIVTLPHLMGKYRKCDAEFGDVCLYDVSPGKFLSLIKEAAYVFTDSFHTTVFSLIFEKQHFTFQRSNAKAMGVRLQSLTSMFGTQQYFCDEPEKLCVDYINSLPPINYTQAFDAFAEAKEASVQFLKTRLAD